MLGGLREYINLSSSGSNAQAGASQAHQRTVGQVRRGHSARGCGGEEVSGHDGGVSAQTFDLGVPHHDGKIA